MYVIYLSLACHLNGVYNTGCYYSYICCFHAVIKGAPNWGVINFIIEMYGSAHRSFALLVGIIYFFYVKYAEKMAYSNNIKKLDEHDRETYTDTRNVLFNNMHQTGQYDL